MYVRTILVTSIALASGLVASAAQASNTGGSVSPLLVNAAGVVGVPNIMEVGNTKTFSSAASMAFAGGAYGPVVNTASYDGFARYEIGDVGINLNVAANVYDQFFAQVSVGAQAGFGDYVTVNGGTNPIGTPVQIKIFTSLEYSTSWAGYAAGPSTTFDFYGPPSVALNSSWDVYYVDPSSAGVSKKIDFSTDQFGESNTLNNDFVIDTYVGATFSISYSMSAFINGGVVQPSMNTPLSSGFNGSVDASNSAHTYMSVLTPGVSLISDSGHDYTPSPVPEPSAYAMMLAGLALVGAAVKRRRG